VRGITILSHLSLPGARVLLMTHMIVQIYEIQTPFEAEKLIELGVDHIGSVVDSERYWKSASIRETIHLTQSAGFQSSLILLFSNLDSILRALDYYQPDIAHFCEALTDHSGIRASCFELMDLQKKVKERVKDIKLMRSIPIPPSGLANSFPALELAHMFEPVSDYFLTDTLLIGSSDISTEHQPISGFIGITGQICDWATARKLIDSSQIPVILAGGISPDNVSDAIHQVRPLGIDSCTGTNAQDLKGDPIRFKKDMIKVKRLLAEVRQAEKSICD
jgi:phosphoribosylanthranilate isomerase